LIGTSAGTSIQQVLHLEIQKATVLCCGLAARRSTRALSNSDLSPHLPLVDMGGHGYVSVRVTSDALEAEFVCIPRPIERSDRADGGPLLYRSRHRASLWHKGETPKLETIVEGDPRFSI
jgi:alkaline phosphatase D